MATRLWGGLVSLSRRNSSQAVEEDSEGEQQDALQRRKSSSHFQTLGPMRGRPGNASPGTDTSQHHHQAAKGRGASGNAASNGFNPPTPGNASGKLSGIAHSSSASSLADQHQQQPSTHSGGSHGPQQQQQQQFDSAAHARATPAAPACDQPSGPAAADAGNTTSSFGNSGSSSGGPDGPGSPEGQATQVSATSLVAAASASSGSSGGGGSNDDGSYIPSQLSLQQQQQEAQGLSEAAGSFADQGGMTFDPHPAPPAAAAGAGGLFSDFSSIGMQAAGVLPGLQQQLPGGGSGLSGMLMNGGGDMGLQQLMAELRSAAGLSEQQLVSAAAVLQRYNTNPAASPASFPAPAAFKNISALLPSNPAPWQAAGIGPAGFPQHSLSPHAPFLSPAPAPLMRPVSVGGVGPGPDYNSNFSSSSTNAQSGTGSQGEGASAGFGAQGLGAAGPFANADLIYGADGLDAPGTAQVAVHNVPFKWCNADLESLFQQLPGYLDAQLLFHENGRSKGVGVALFRDRAAASEAVQRLTGAQADGRKLELVLMNPDNHISFSCKQVAVLGLPWEYTAADVTALIEAAAEADDMPTADAGVEAVEVAYREDGKSEGRAIATFRSRSQAHAAISRLHGRETLAGLRMRLFYLHEQQQRQQLLAQTPQSLLTSLGQLSLDSPSPAFAAAGTGASKGGQPPMPGDASADDFGSHGFGAQAAFSSIGSVEGDVTLATFFNHQHNSSSNAINATTSNSGEFAQQQQAQPPQPPPQQGGSAGGGDGAGSAAAPAGSAEGSSTRSSLDKDAGPVILHVSGLMESVSREQLRELFSQAGEVTKVDIPDGGRSMGYGFITFSNPQAAEQAMLQFNNYPLGGGAIHVAYSTSATAKARQQALRQARKATLGARVSMDGGAASGAGPRPAPLQGPALLGQAAGLGAGRRGGGGGPVPFDEFAGLAGPAGMDPMGAGFSPAIRHSFDQPSYTGYTSPGGPGFFRSRALSATGLGMSPAGLSPAAMGGMSPAGMGMGMGSAGGPGPGGAGRGRRGSFGPGVPGPQLSPAQLHHLHLLQAAVGGNPGAAMAAGLGQPGLEGLSMEQLQLLIQMGGADAAGLAAAVSQGFSMGAGPFAPPGTQPFGGGGLGARGPAGLFPPMPAGLGLLGPGGAGPAGFMGQLPLQPPGGGMAFDGMPGGPFGGPGAAGAWRGPEPSSTVVVTGLPAGLDDSQLRALFGLCGRVQSISSPHDQDCVVVSFESAEGAARAMEVLNTSYLPGATSPLNVQFAPTYGLAAPGAEAPATPAQPTGEFRPPGSATGGLGLFGGVDAAASYGLSTPQRLLAHQASRGSAASGAGAGDSFAAGGGGGGSASGSGSLWAAPDAASGLAASSVGGFDTNPRPGHASPVPAGISAPWDSAAAVAALAAGSSGVPGSPVSTARPPVPGYSRTVGSTRPSGDAAAGAAVAFGGGAFRSSSPVGGMPGTASPVPGGAGQQQSVYASPLYQAAALGNAADMFGRVASSSALTAPQNLHGGFAGMLAPAEHGSSGSLRQLQQQRGVQGHATVVDELPSAALVAAWGDLGSGSAGAAAAGGTPEESAAPGRSDGSQ